MPRMFTISVPGRTTSTFRLSQSAVRIFNNPSSSRIWFSYLMAERNSNIGRCIIGTTWVQELVWMVVNDCDFEKGKKEQLSIRSPFLEWVIRQLICFYYYTNSINQDPFSFFLLIRMNYMLPMKLAEKFEKEAICRWELISLVVTKQEHGNFFLKFELK
jgi:hypothetical protein